MLGLLFLVGKNTYKMR